MHARFGIFTFFTLFTPVLGQQPAATPEPIREQVVVTASRSETRIGDTPASIVTLSRSEIGTSAAPTIDDLLRQTTGFSIFRRSSSRSANPTTQGVSLRGVGASGASRSVILFDGVPLNDPFGGWIQWNRVSPIELESIEVLRGGASSLYGDGGLSGAVNMLPRRDGDLAYGIDVFGGTQKTLSGSGFFASELKNWLFSVNGSSYQTRGYKPVEEIARGPVDSFAGVRSNNLRVRIGRDLRRFGSVFLSPSYFGEVRSNGTGMQTNRTHIRQLIAGGDLQKRVIFRWRAFGGTQVYDQVFSAVNASRTAESLTRIQRVPVQNIGFSAQLSAVIGNHTLVGGVDSRNIRGTSDEVGFSSSPFRSLTGSGGRQTNTGALLRDVVTIGKRVVLSGGVRVDHWTNYSARIVTQQVPFATMVTLFPDRDETAFSPQIALLVRSTDRLSLYANASRSFRSPTLNELYRGFRVGDIVTLANENLRAERANNFEAGINFGEKSTFFRANAFLTNIDDPIANVRQPSIPTVIVRQRQNMGSTRSVGFEAEGETTFRGFTLSGGYIYARSTVKSFPQNESLVGLNVPQVARHQFTLQSAYTRSKWTFSLQARASSSQFDDDQNVFRLEPYAQIDVYGSRELKNGLVMFVAAENVLSSRYSIGKTPIRTVSSPINIRIGIRWGWKQ